jgi:hypothetical protein
MWMLDVFCCALGCVTLLFLLNSRMATDAVRASRAALLDLKTSDKKLAAALTTLEEARARLASEEKEHQRLAANVTELEGIRLRLAEESRKLADQLKVARAERDETGRKLALARDEAKQARTMLDATRADLAAAEKKADAAAMDLAGARARVADTAELLKKKQADLDALAKKESDAAAQLDTHRKLLRAKDADRLALENRVAALRKEMADAEAKLRASQRELDANLATAKKAAKAAADELASAKAAAKKAGDELAATKAGSAKAGEELGTARAQIKDLTKKVDDANATIIDLQGEKAKLADKFNKIQLEKESRFAGIAMSGRRAIFLVDMSGSMGKRDLNTLDPAKWPLVIDTVGKVMRSMPALEQYQVVVFSSSASWLFGAGEWRNYEGEKSVGAVTAALLKVKPKDDTNMYAALDKAFTLRPGGLDTIYLFSDGLPTSGPGLSPAQQGANLSESELGAVLGKYVRDKLQRDWNRPEPGKPRVKINSVGFYFESSDVGAFLWSLSRENDGSFVGMSKP